MIFTSVGASLLANAIGQLHTFCLTHRFREQARSHRVSGYNRDRV